LFLFMLASFALIACIAIIRLIASGYAARSAAEAAFYILFPLAITALSTTLGIRALKIRFAEFALENIEGNLILSSKKVGRKDSLEVERIIAKIRRMIKEKLATTA